MIILFILRTCVNTGDVLSRFAIFEHLRLLAIPNTLEV